MSLHSQVNQNFVDLTQIYLESKLVDQGAVETAFNWLRLRPVPSDKDEMRKELDRAVRVGNGTLCPHAQDWEECPDCRH